MRVRLAYGPDTKNLVTTFVEGAMVRGRYDGLLPTADKLPECTTIPPLLWAKCGGVGNLIFLTQTHFFQPLD